jgi:hypothetical protein
VVAVTDELPPYARLDGKVVHVSTLAQALAVSDFVPDDYSVAIDDRAEEIKLLKLMEVFR